MYILSRAATLGIISQNAYARLYLPRMVIDLHSPAPHAPGPSSSCCFRLRGGTYRINSCFGIKNYFGIWGISGDRVRGRAEIPSNMHRNCTGSVLFQVYRPILEPYPCPSSKTKFSVLGGYEMTAKVNFVFRAFKIVLNPRYARIWEPLDIENLFLDDGHR